jgi:CxxC motif-containing protein (DUF1111 family)
MKNRRLMVTLLLAALLAVSVIFDTVRSQGQQNSNAQTNQADKVSGTAVTVTTCGQEVDCEDGRSPEDNFTFDASDGARPVAAGTPCCDICPITIEPCAPAEEAPAAFDNQTNDERFLPQGDAIVSCSPAPTPGTFEADKVIFGAVDEKADGLGPVYNAQSCRECHQNPVDGAISQVTELRAGHNMTYIGGTAFVDAPGGSLINDRAINPKIQERVPPLFSAGLDRDQPVNTFRTSLNLLGDGFVEAVANETLLSISDAQNTISGGTVHGQAIAVPVLEANFLTNRDCANPNLACIRRIGRFGWKDQLPSLLSFSGDAYLNEIGITNFLIINENTSLGRSVADFDEVPDNTHCDEQLCPNPDDCPCGEDAERDIDTFTAFMRATKAPPQDTDIQQDFSADIAAGRELFSQMPNGPGYSCSLCHVPAMLTALPETRINGGEFAVPDGLGFKVIRPFGDFLLHNIGTGDGIVQNGGQSTRLKVRTPPLWGVRTRTRLLHDGSALTLMDAIFRHQGEAAAVEAAFEALDSERQRQLILFLESL